MQRSSKLLIAWSFSSALCSLSWGIEVAGPGYVCPMEGGAWASTTSFPGCSPMETYAAAEREVARLNDPRNAAPRPQYVPFGTAKLNGDADSQGQAQDPLPARASVLDLINAPQASRKERANPEYDRAVAELESRYPQLNPDLPAFDPAAAQAVLKKKRALVQQGVNQEVALRAAAGEVMSAHVAAAPSQLPVSAQSRPKPTGQEAVIAAGAEGAAQGVVYALLGLAAVTIGWLYRRSRAVASRSLHAINAISATDIARQTGRMSSKVEKKTSEVVSAYREGRGR